MSAIQKLDDIVTRMPGADQRDNSLYNKMLQAHASQKKGCDDIDLRKLERDMNCYF